MSEYDFGKDNWDIFLRWTYQYTSVSNSVSTSPDPAVFSLKDFSQNLGVLATSVAQAGKASWQNRLNVLDFEMGYDYFLSQPDTFGNSFTEKHDNYARQRAVGTIAVGLDVGIRFDF
ncbi:hypothetical protein [Candidatus Neptunichlamydia sp. REUL1]|uniref:hypothetical protein n=1 Tax=Candidatus Neptunichlamydia sp. REUL1 TaxID=3064277 RepID=UPI002931A09D|nr:hypothetical protein [Candidatus Neptunochlamydia sp. REUL1]